MGALNTFVVKRLSAQGYTRAEIGKKFSLDERFWLSEEVDEAYKDGKREYVRRVLAEAVREGIID